MKRGDIYYANLDPTIGSEIKKKRPVIIVSNNANNANASLVTIVPITSNTAKVYSFEVLLEKSISKLPKRSKALCNQIRTISKHRLGNKTVSHLDASAMKMLDEAIKLHLAIL